MSELPYAKGYANIDEARTALVGLGIPKSMLGSTGSIPLFFRDNPGLCLVYTKEGLVHFTDPTQIVVEQHLDRPEIKSRLSIETLCSGASGVIDDIVAAGVGLVVAHTTDGTSIDIVDKYGKPQYEISYSTTTGTTKQKPLAENIPGNITEIADAVEALLRVTKDSYDERLNPIFDVAGSD